jgi:hypothetical protein
MALPLNPASAYENILITQNCQISAPEGNRKMKFNAGTFREVPSVLAARMVDDYAYATRDLSVVVTPKQKAGVDFENVGLTAPQWEAMKLETIGGVPSKRIYAWAKLTGLVELNAGESGYFPIADADAAIFTEAATEIPFLIDWPERGRGELNHIGPKVVNVI